MELIDLGVLKSQLEEKFQLCFTGNDVKLPIAFKKRVGEINNSTIEYLEYTAIIISSGLYIYAPNQWFFIAAFFCEYVKMLDAYKNKCLTWLQDCKGLSKIDSENQIQKLKNKESQAQALFSDYTGDDKELLIKFVSDYSWWGGGKTIDRGDYFLSPVLAMGKLVNQSQAYVATICQFLTENPDCLAILSEELEIIESDTTTKATKEFIFANKSLQQIYYGAPGTGKSHIIKERTKGKNVIRTTFHPDSDYSTFVGAYKPATKEVTLRDLSGHVVVENGQTVKEEKIVYEFVNQAFLQAYVSAWKAYADARQDETPNEQYLVIEEINRGNCAQIFGDLFQLLDRNDSGFSDYPIKADNDMKKQLVKAFEGLSIPHSEAINALYDEDDIVKQVLSGEVLLLPNNLYIWATMNTSDQSLFPVDSAFKRRWDWKYMPINDANMNWRIAVDEAEYDWWQFLTKVNEYIGSITNSEDKKLGYFFCKTKNSKIDAETFVGKVVFYLWNDVFKDYGFDGPLFQASDGSTLAFDKFYGADANSINEANVAEFLRNLGVPPIDTEDELNDETADKGPSDDDNI